MNGVTPQHRKPSTFNRKPSRLICVAGSTVLLAGASAGTIVLWPSSAAARSPSGDSAAGPDGAGAGSGAARPGELTADGRPDSQELASSAGPYLASRAHAAAMSKQAAGRRAVLRRQLAAKLAAEAAARRRAEQAQQAAAPAPTEQPAATAAPAPAAPASSGSPQQIAESMLGSFGWSASEFSCLDLLWNAESGWNVYASNPTSGAYGIPQALPGAKMASAGPDWESDAATQIRWGLEYIQSDYGSPCGAWDHEEADGWY